MDLRADNRKATGPTGLAAMWLMIGLAAHTAGGEIVGWRTDGTGLYPEATPVLEWGGDKNVIWKTEMPARGNATPVITGNRLFVCAEQTKLVCVNLADGQILWQHENGYETLAASPEEAETIRASMKKARELNGMISQILSKQQEIRKTLKEQGDNAELSAENERLEKRASELRAEFQSFKEYLVPQTQDVNGYSSPTPVTDGRHVWALFGTGVAVCYDMEGSRVWARNLEKPPHADYGMSSSPVLVGGVLMVHIDNLYGLEAETGRELWKVKIPWGWGTAVPAKIGGVDVIFTSQGNVVRVSDGLVLPPTLFKLEYNGATLAGDVIYYIQNNGRAYRLPKEFTDDMKLDELWVANIHNDRYYSCPLIHDGLVYAITQARRFTVLDAATGQTVYVKDLDLGSGIVYQAITLAGNHIFISSESGTTIVIEPGRQYKEVARNTLESFRACPVFQGSRMYIRGLKNLYCIGTQ